MLKTLNSSINYQKKWNHIIESFISDFDHLAAETIFEKIEENNIDVNNNDITFLTKTVLDINIIPSYVNTIIRLFGMLAEKNVNSLRQIILFNLRNLLSHDNAQYKYYIVKALWQAKDYNSLQNLKQQLRYKQPKNVILILKRAINVLTI